MSWILFADGFENSGRRKIIKVLQAYQLYKELVKYHAVQQLLAHIQDNKIKSFEQLTKAAFTLCITDG